MRVSSKYPATAPGPEARDLAAKVQIGDYIEVVTQGKVLIDRRDSQRSGVQRRRDLHALAAKVELALVGQLHPGNRLDECGFSCPVVADQRDDLSGVDLEVDAGESLVRAKSLAEALQREQRCCA